ncbi:MAG: hypothetical protein KGQ36_06735 [Rickettsiales bacterium]|nr:hypothetical protein [Rickettsiales bacterium]
MNEILDKIEASFKAALRGEETVNIMIYRWGLFAWIVAYFVINKLIMLVNIRFFDILVSIIAAAYFAVHIYALRKCTPKKPRLSDEEKKKMKEEARKDFGKKVARKLLLQESITKWNPVTVTTVVDLLCITHFLGYVF